MGAFGGNDYGSTLFASRPLPEVHALIPHVVDSIGRGVERLIAEGAAELVVPGLLPTGCFPLYLSMFPRPPEGYGARSGCIKEMNTLSWAHNAALQRKIAELRGKHPDVRIIYTRRTDVFVELDERAHIANRNHADLFISVHCNAGPKGSRGTEVWTMGLHKSTANLGVAQRENSVILQEKNYKQRYDGFDPSSPQSHILFSLFQSAYITNSLRLAQRIDRQFRTSVGRSSRGVKQAGFLVLWKSTMPSVLVEAGFLTDRAEENYLDSKAGQQGIANGIYRAFREYKHDLEGTPAE